MSIERTGASSPSSSATIVPVVLSGGAGSRLWPYSTEETPKQFLSFTGTRSLFQLTLERVSNRDKFAAPIVVGSVRHAVLCEGELMAERDDYRLILEPCARNTAVAIAMAAHSAKAEHGGETLLLVMPSDHLIDDIAAFHEGVRSGEAAASAGKLVTFGIRPTSPDTGFGYLEAGGPLDGLDAVREVTRFIEKPKLEVAESFVAGGRHLWNAGIFLFRADTFLSELAEHAPGIAEAAEQAFSRARCEANRLTADESALSGCPSQSVDYAVMERSSKVAVVPLSTGWSDLGSWDALAELTEGNPLGPITMLDCDDCYIRSDGVQVAALGVRDLIIVASGERLLILPKGRSQEVKKLLSVMEAMAA